MFVLVAEGDALASDEKLMDVSYDIAVLLVFLFFFHSFCEP